MDALYIAMDSVLFQKEKKATLLIIFSYHVLVAVMVPRTRARSVAAS